MREYIDNYKESMVKLSFSDIQKENMIRRLTDVNRGKNGGFMKAKNRAFKWVVTAATCMILMGCTAFATVKILGIASHNRFSSRTSDFAKLSDLENETGIDVTAVENFANGYAFDSMEINDAQVQDEDFNTVQEYTELGIQYKKSGMAPVSIYMYPSVINTIDGGAQGSDNAQMSRTVDGITLNYSKDEYLFIPAKKGSAPTEEELAREESDSHFFISYGSDEKKTSYASNVVFEMDGVFYNIGSFDNSMSAEEFLDMAEEIVKAR